jgi:hypothetical protein
MNIKFILDPQNLALMSIGLVAILAAVLIILQRKPNPDAVEARRRALLVRSGRLVDGSVIDLYEQPPHANAPGRTQILIVYQYEIAGVIYECSQEIGLLPISQEPDLLQPGLQCTVRYLPHNPYNSIVVAENWTGLHTRISQTKAAGG